MAYSAISISQSVVCRGTVTRGHGSLQCKGSHDRISHAVLFNLVEIYCLLTAREMQRSNKCRQVQGPRQFYKHLVVLKGRLFYLYLQLLWM